MKKQDRREQARAIAKDATKKYGHRTGAVGSDLGGAVLDVVPTGFLSLDYALGTGGWPTGFMTEVFGIPDIGKSSIFGLSGIREAQKIGKLCGIICMEPSFDEGWARKHGVDTDELVVVFPDDGEDAFSIFYDWVREGVPDYILFDSIGAITSPIAETKDKGAPKAYGESRLISDGVKAVAPLIWKNDITAILLNQVRDDTKGRIPGLLDSPGGHALRHLCPLRLQVKPGKNRYTTKIDGADVLYGREIFGIVKRNKLVESSGPGTKAAFDFYHKQVEGEPFGLDVGKDVTDTGPRTGAIEKAGSWFSHPAFPAPKHKLQGADAVTEFIKNNPPAYEAIRKDIIAAMLERNEQALLKTPLEAVADEEDE